MIARIALLLAVSAACFGPSQEKQKARRWTDDTGRYSIEAEFVRHQDGKVFLRRADGTIIDVPLTRFSERDQDYVKSLLARRDAVEHTASDQPYEGRAESATAGRPAIEKALEKRHDVNIAPTPLRDAIRHLLALEQIPYHINWRSLADELGVRGDETVEFAAKGIAVRDAIDKLLSSRDMAWLIRDEVFYVTAPIDSDMPRNREVVVYRTNSSQARTNALVKSVKSRIFPQSWNTAGGSGRITVLGDGVIVIVQHATIQREVLRRFRKTLEPVYATRPTVVRLSAGESLSPTQAIHQLAKSDFLDVPLKDAVAKLQAAHGVRIVFDRPAIDDSGISVDSPVTLQLHAMQLESALSLLTEQLELSWYLEGQHILITPRVHAQQKLEETIYDVGDIVKAAGRNSLPSLAAAIRTTLRTPTWIKTAPQNPVEVRAAERLEVCACFADHRRIERLLGDLRGQLTNFLLDPRWRAADESC